MIKRELVINYPGTLMVILTVIGCYYFLSYILDKRNISKRNKEIITTVSIIGIIVLFFALKLLIYKKICVEVGTAKTAYNGANFFWK